MRKVIRGKLYDTSTATKVGERTVGSPRDFSHIQEELYRKRTGEYFLYGFGGAQTQYAETVDVNTWKGGEKIIPLTYEEAREWAEKHLSTEEYEEAFGLPDEAGEQVEVRAWVSPATKAVIERERSRTGETVAEVIERVMKGL